jgi:hypothetical protein
VKAFPVLTDEAMPGDLAVSRTQGVTDPEKYTLIIDGDKKTIVNIATTTTNLIINYKSTDPFNLDGAGQLNHFWEDVLYIHTDEIDVEDKTPYQIFQLSLVVSGAKHAMTIQCSRADDLKHLVSALQYFIRNSRLGHDTALAGMPYENQGMLLAGDNQVQKLWADSPAGRAGVNLGDHLWSVGFITPKQQEMKDVEAGLQSNSVLYSASNAVWDKALMAYHAPGQGNPFKPKLRKVILGTS